MAPTETDSRLTIVWGDRPFAVLTGLWHEPEGCGDRLAVVVCMEGELQTFLEESEVPALDSDGRALIVHCSICDQDHDLISLFEAMEVGWLTTTEGTDRETISVDVLGLVANEMRSLKRKRSPRAPALPVAAAR